MPMCDLGERNCRLRVMALAPKVVEAIRKNLGSDLTLLLATKRIDRLTFARRPVQLAVSYLQKEIELYQRTIHVVLLNVGFPTACGHIRVEESIEVLF